MANLSVDVLDEVYKKGAANARTIDAPDGSTAVLVPDGYSVHKLPPLEAKLPRIRQTTTFYDQRSFIAYVNEFKVEGSSRIFAMPGHLSSDKVAKLVAILDYHTPKAAEYGAHVARYFPKYSEPWLRWVSGPNAIAGKPMAQAEFGEFIEENRIDVRDPSAAALLDIVNKFKATKKAEFNSVTNAVNGDIVLGYQEDTVVHGSREGFHVPSELALGIPVFFKGVNYEVKMLMRYRLDTGKVTFVVKPDRPEYTEQHAFDEIAAQVGEATNVTPFLGMPA